VISGTYNFKLNVLRKVKRELFKNKSISLLEELKSKNICRYVRNSGKVQLENELE